MVDTIISAPKGDTESKVNTPLHINSQECNGSACKKQKQHYIQILNVEQYVEQLNDWD